MWHSIRGLDNPALRRKSVQRGTQIFISEIKAFIGSLRISPALWGGGSETRADPARQSSQGGTAEDQEQRRDRAEDTDKRETVQN